MPASRPRPLLALAAVLLVAVGVAVVIGANLGQHTGIAAGPTPTIPTTGSQSPSASDGQPTPTTSTDFTPGPSLEPTPTLDATAKVSPLHSVDPADLTGYVWPARHALITSRFAPRLAIDGGFAVIDGVAYHDGIDLATHCGDHIYAAHDGTVLYAGRNFDPYLGYLGDPAPIYDRLVREGRINSQPIVVVIDDGNGYRSIYVHLNSASVEAGALVMAGDVVGVEGATGFATGCHLHYGLIRMDGGWQGVVERLWQYGYPQHVRERVDPLKVLPWGDEFAPERLREHIYGTPSPLPSVEPSPTIEISPSPDESPVPSGSPATSDVPSASPSPAN